MSSHKEQYDAGRLATTSGGTPKHFDAPAPDPETITTGPRAGQHKDYWVLSGEERAKGFVRPVRSSYRHVGPPGPRYELRALTDEEIAQTKADNPGWDAPGAGADLWAYFEIYPESERPALGRYWTDRDLLRASKGCGTVTTMGRALAETYAREPGFYGSTFCCGCGTHLPVGRRGEFVWDGTDERVGT